VRRNFLGCSQRRGQIPLIRFFLHEHGAIRIGSDHWRAKLPAIIRSPCSSMPRRRRIDLPGIPQHIVQRGNNRGVCFFSNDDRFAYLHLLLKHARTLCVDVHAYVLMTNHVHLLATARQHGAISTLMQDIGREYVQLVNATNRRSGTLWEGRFYSCLVDSERYLLTCMRYIELNPIRACMVDDPADYPWSSFPANALDRTNELITGHDAYVALGCSSSERCRAYRELFASALDPEDERALRRHTQQRAAWGSERFQQEVAAMLGRAVSTRPPGRPRRAPVNGI
jgi:putative transposase